MRPTREYNSLFFGRLYINGQTKCHEHVKMSEDVGWNGFARVRGGNTKRRAARKLYVPLFSLYKRFNLMDLVVSKAYIYLYTADIVYIQFVNWKEGVKHFSCAYTPWKMSYWMGSLLKFALTLYTVFLTASRLERRICKNLHWFLAAWGYNTATAQTASPTLILRRAQNVWICMEYILNHLATLLFGFNELRKKNAFLHLTREMQINISYCPAFSYNNEY